MSVAIHATALAHTSGRRSASSPSDQLYNATFAVPRGTTFGILGPQSNAKATLLQILLGVLQPTTGKATILDYDLASQVQQIRLHVGALMANTNVYTHLTAIDNLDYFGRIWRIPSTNRQTRAQELLTLLGLWERRQERPANWTPLLKQKLALARTLVHRPSILLLEEPTDCLDPTSAAAFRTTIKQLTIRDELTVLIALSNADEARELCSLGAYMQQGELGPALPIAQLCANCTQNHLEITGRGFTPSVVALLQQRQDVLSVSTAQNRLLVKLSGEVDTAPIITLLVEASADVEEVHRC